MLLHAVMDALLGAAALGDIGRLFPDNDDALSEYFQHGPAGADGPAPARRRLCARQYRRHRGGPAAEDRAIYPADAENIARVLQIPMDQVNVKGTTEEKLGFTGDGSGIAAHAVCLIEKI